MRNALYVAALIAVCSVAATEARAGSFTVTIPDPAANVFTVYGTGAASVTYKDSGGNNVLFAESTALGTNAELLDIGVQFSGYPAVLESENASKNDENIVITLPFFVDSFRLLYNTKTGTSVTFLLSDGASSTQGSSASFDAATVYLVSSATPFDTVTITTAGGTAGGVFIDNLSYVTPAATPEPGTLTLLGTGLVSLGAFVRRRVAA